MFGTHCEVISINIDFKKTIIIYHLISYLLNGIKKYHIIFIFLCDKQSGIDKI